MIERIRRHKGQHPALIDSEHGKTLSYGDLVSLMDRRAEQLRAASAGRGVVFVAMSFEIDAVVFYLACLQARLPICLVDPDDVPIARLAETYAPELLLLPAALAPPPGYLDASVPWDGPTYRLWRRERLVTLLPHPDLALLLTTSGSTGNPKLVRLTMRNLESNALAIGEYLRLTPDERAVQSLPLQYSYGLSVLNSHLLAGGSVVLTPHSFMRREFWQVVDALGCTSFAGVPYIYETLHRLRFDSGRHPSLRTLTQAGGGLRVDLIAHFHQLSAASNARFFVMYGQTEATARISYVPAERLSEKKGSIGIPIPGGKLSLRPVEGTPGLDELVYEGPNVMMGYAEGPQDLALGDVQGGVLRTGDLGRMDADGYFSVVGRLNRFAKLYGRRVSLEDIERELEASFPVRAAALDGNERIVVHVLPLQPVELSALTGHVARYLNVPPQSVNVRLVQSLPMTAAGKMDYRSLETLGT